jgi:hypothetical protein
MRLSRLRRQNRLHARQRNALQSARRAHAQHLQPLFLAVHAHHYVLVPAPRHPHVLAYADCAFPAGARLPGLISYAQRTVPPKPVLNLRMELTLGNVVPRSNWYRPWPHPPAHGPRSTVHGPRPISTAGSNPSQTPTAPADSPEPTSGRPLWESPWSRSFPPPDQRRCRRQNADAPSA